MNSSDQGADGIKANKSYIPEGKLIPVAAAVGKIKDIKAARLKTSTDILSHKEKFGFIVP